VRYESGRLNAILGIFHTLNKSHYLAVPLMAPALYLASEKQSTSDFLASLEWMHEQPTERRTEFPCWSWTGWNGVLKEDKGGQITDIKVWIEYLDLHPMAWPANESLVRMGSTEVSQFLRIQVWTLQLWFESFEEVSENRSRSVSPVPEVCKCRLRGTPGNGNWS
jgi:hypothetical protein